MTDSTLHIPRVFHHIWLGDKPLPDHFRIWAERWETINPGWRVRYWNDRNLPEIVNKSEYEKAEKMAAKSDILRYEICLKFGGVYIDADFEPLRPIEPLLQGVQSFQADELDDRPCNALLGCAPGDPFYQALVDGLPASIARGGDIVETTGPAFLKRTIASFLGPDRKRIDDPAPGVEGRRWRITSADGHRSLHGFHYSVFYPYHYDQPKLENASFPDAFGKHHWTASWWKNGGV